MAPRTYTVKFIPGGFSKSAATYGSGNYGDDKTYGQEAVDPLGGVVYALRPFPGWWPQEPAWQFRQHDTGLQWEGVLTSFTGDLPLTSLSSARLILDGVEVTGSGRASRLHFPLDISDTINNRLVRKWEDGDLAVPGVFRTTVQCIFGSGKQMTVQANDRNLTHIREAAGAP